MAKQANPENRYTLTCKVTGETVKTNPKQFASLANRYGITNEELDSSYVSRAGRRVIASENLSPESASEKYSIHINVARSLKCTVKEKKAKEKETTPDAEQLEVQPNGTTAEAVQESPVEVTEVDGVVIERGETSFSASIPADVEDGVPA